MSGADTSLAIGLCIALAVSLGNWRAWGWLLAGAASYAVSTIYWRLGLPYGAFIGGLCDAAICLAVYFLAKLRWELWVWRLYQVSVGVNFIYLGGTMGVWGSLQHNDYAIILEAINWLALIFIGGTGWAQMVGAADVSDAPNRPWSRVRRLAQALYRPRAHAAFTKAGR